MFGCLNETGWFTEHGVKLCLTLACPHQQRSGVWLAGAAVSRVTLQREDFGCEPAADLFGTMDCLCQALFKETLTTFIYNTKRDIKVT